MHPNQNKSLNNSLNKKPKPPTPKEVVAEDTSFLDHLTPHLSGDAFTHSNLNSPNHPINKFLNVTSEAPQEPPIITVQTPPPQSVVPEQDNQPPTQTLIPESPTQNIEKPQAEPQAPQSEQNNYEA